jgi:hypothetical protein
MHVLLEKRFLVSRSLGLQSMLKHFNIIVIHRYSVMCLLLSAAMRSNTCMSEQNKGGRHALPVILQLHFALGLGFGLAHMYLYQGDKTVIHIKRSCHSSQMCKQSYLSTSLRRRAFHRQH